MTEMSCLAGNIVSSLVKSAGGLRSGEAVALPKETGRTMGKYAAKTACFKNRDPPANGENVHNVNKRGESETLGIGRERAGR